MVRERSKLFRKQVTEYEERRRKVVGVPFFPERLFLLFTP